MIVLEVHVYGLAILEAEHHPPVAGDPDTPLVRPVALHKDAAGSQARPRSPDVLPLAGGTGYAGAVARDGQAGAPGRPARATPAGLCA